jgi:hypothetical protein
MSWDVILFSSKEKIESIAGFDENILLPIDFNSIFRSFFEVIKTKGSHSEIVDKDFSIDFYVHDSNVSNILISIYGEKGYFKIIEFSKTYNLQVFDTSLNDFVDIENPDKNGFSKFQNYLNKIKNE